MSIVNGRLKGNVNSPPKVAYRKGWSNSIPAELRERPQWIVWKYVLKPDGKWTKVLFRVDQPNVEAKSNDPSTWSTFAAAVECFRQHRQEYRLAGIGYVFSADDPFIGIDLDHCLDEDGAVMEWARTYLDRLPTYAEVSPSGRGVKLVARGVHPGKGHKRTGLGPNGAAVEMYDRGRYFAITGSLLDGSPGTIEDLAGPVAALHAELFPPKAKATTRAKADTEGISPDDETLLAKARSAKNGAKFCALFDRGDTSGHDGDQSRADFALCGMLAFYWGPDAAAVDRMFRRSGLMRDKWNASAGAQTYGELTVSNVLEGKTEFFTPPIPTPKLKAAGSKDKGGGKPPEEGEPAAPADERPAVEINPERHRVVDESIKALAGDPDLYSRGDFLVQVVAEDRDTVNLTGKTDLRNVAGTPRIVGLSDAVVGCKLTRCAEFFQWKKGKNGEFVTVRVHPSDWLIRAVSTHKYWPGIRKLESVVECPYPRADGSIVETPGYDHGTRTLFVPAIEFPPVPENPTREDAVAAWGRISATVGEFPFASDDDRAVYLAGLLTVIARPAITGPVPGIAVVGNKAGCGKGLLIDSIGLTAHGRIVPTSSYPGDKEEATKVKVSIARGGFTVVHFDNLEEGTSYGTSALDSSMTSMAINDRILGLSENTGDLKLRPAWFLSGNNISPGKDAHRRWLPCNLFTELERPEEREDIVVKDLKAHVLANRAELVRDALTILRAHAGAKRPGGDWAALGSFEEWDTVVRGAVWFATGRDCNATRRKAADDAPARQAKLALLIGWTELPEGTKLGITAAKAVELAEKTPELYATLRNALLHFGKDGKLASSRAVGTILRGMKGNLMDGLRFVEAEKEHGAVRWKVIGSNPDTPTPPVKGECGECGECQAPDLAGWTDSDNYESTYARDAHAHLASAEIHSPDSPHSPGDDYSNVDWDGDLEA